MFKIGEFSQLTRVSVRMLRHYDALGLLRPVRVDQFTDYRYYSASQLPRLNRILALRDMGLTLDQVGQVLDAGPLNSDQLRGMLRLKRAELQQQLAVEMERLARVDARLLLIDQEDDMSAYEVILKPLSTQRYASMRGTVPGREQIGAFLGPAFERIYCEIGRAGVIPQGFATALYHRCIDEAWDIEAAVAVASPLPAASGIECREIPAEPQAACTVHRGSFAALEGAYNAMFRWIEANDFQITGAPREINIVYSPDADPATYVTEIQVPVTKN